MDLGAIARRVAFDHDLRARVFLQSRRAARRARRSDSGRISAESNPNVMLWMIEPQPSAGGAGSPQSTLPAPAVASVYRRNGPRFVDRTPVNPPSAATLRMNALGVLSLRLRPVARRMLPLTVPLKSPARVVASRDYRTALRQLHPIGLRSPHTAEVRGHLRRLLRAVADDLAELERRGWAHDVDAADESQLDPADRTLHGDRQFGHHSSGAMRLQSGRREQRRSRRSRSTRPMHFDQPRERRGRAGVSTMFGTAKRSNVVAAGNW